MTANPILYSFRRCPYAIRARMALHYAGIDVEHREVLLKDIPDQMRRISPKATVPVLQLADGTVIDESRDIVYWALEQHDPKQWRRDAPELTKALIDQNDNEFKPNLDKYKYSVRFPERPQKSYRNDGSVFLDKLEECLADSAGKGLVAKDYSVADICIFPFIRQFAGVDRQWFEASPYQRLVGWYRELIELPLFKDVMTKHPVWQSN